MSNQDQEVMPSIFNLTPGKKYGREAVGSMNKMNSALEKYYDIAHKGFRDEKTGQVHRMQFVHGEQDQALVRDLLVDDLQYDPRTQLPALKDGKVIVTKNRFQKWNDQAYTRGTRDDTSFIHSNEVSAYKAMIERFIRWPAPKPEIMPERDIGRGMLKWSYFRTNDVPAPESSITMEQRDNTIPTNTQYDANLLGFYYDYHLDMVTRDAGNNPNAIFNLMPRKQDYIMQELTRSMAVYKQWYHYRGTSITPMRDLGITGLINDSGVTNQTTIGNSGSLTTYGNIKKAAGALAATLLEAKRFPPYTLDITPGVFIQAATQNLNIYTGKSELQELYDMTDTNKQMMFNNIRINPFLIAGATETNSTGAIACYKIGEEDFEFVYSYPMAFYPLPPITLGVDGKLLFMGRTILMQPSAVAYGGSLTTAAF